MTRVLVTGMSGTGKSSVLAELHRRGHRTVDTDYGGWCVVHGSERLWHEERMDALLADDVDGILFVAGCVANQGRFYHRFDEIVLLSAPLDVLLARVSARRTNPYGQDPAERAAIIEHVATIEPLLRKGATA
ncbi:MAG TPA: AAA family ATPase, partial [Micromonosporaceae bacterium]